MEQWIADAVGRMHIHKITQTDIANNLGVTREYVSMILRGVKTPKRAKERINRAINEIIAEKSE